MASGDPTSRGRRGALGSEGLATEDGSGGSWDGGGQAFALRPRETVTVDGDGGGWSGQGTARHSRSRKASQGLSTVLHRTR